MSVQNSIERPSERVALSGTLGVRWYDEWHHEVERALAALPEMPGCPHDLFALLARNPTAAQKRIALVTDGGQPVAVVCLRRRKHHWLVVTDLVVPRAVAPAVPGRLFDAIRALKVYVRIADWEGPLPEGRIYALEQRPAWRVPTRVDLDALWKRNGTTNMDTLRKARNRCHRLGKVELEIDQPGAAEWTIRNWAGKWEHHDYGLTTATEDVLAAATWLFERGRYRAFRLLIDGQPVAGVNFSVQGNVAYAQNSYREPALAKSGIGVHLDELIYRWAQTSPYDYVDLGCGDDYRGRWGELTGKRSDFVIAPPHLYAARQLLQFVRHVPARVVPHATGAAGYGATENGGPALLPDLLARLSRAEFP
jgi:hypothetical protein